MKDPRQLPPYLKLLKPGVGKVAVAEPAAVTLGDIREDQILIKNDVEWIKQNVMAGTQQLKAICYDLSVVLDLLKAKKEHGDI